MQTYMQLKQVGGLVVKKKMNIQYPTRNVQCPSREWTGLARIQNAEARSLKSRIFNLKSLIDIRYSNF